MGRQCQCHGHGTVATIAGALHVADRGVLWAVAHTLMGSYGCSKPDWLTSECHSEYSLA